MTQLCCLTQLLHLCIKHGKICDSLDNTEVESYKHFEDDSQHMNAYDHDLWKQHLYALCHDNDACDNPLRQQEKQSI